ncbi:MAG TPA: NAD(P)H-dependent glycerol-3-phosphate dehydrogenase [Gemmatimonadaceae bacterium]|nr:NAD(P)H-dependent glycerol-3-phosphate dehydrogenase [Gemmatimonadaceae bacterium]
MTRCAVIGAGAWGTALANVLAHNDHEVLLWAREPDVVQSINERHVNERFLAGHPLHPEVRATSEMRAALDGAALVTYVPPSHALRAVAAAARDCLPPDATVVVASKGIERGTLDLMTDVVTEEIPGRPVVALSGPSFAAEVAARQPTAIVAACEQRHAATMTQEHFSNAVLRVYTTEDVVGVELGGSLKNVMAVATGIAEGLGLGFNSRAALITRGLAEMTRLGVALGASPRTFAGLAGLGDLVLTCTGSLSRNRALGVEIGKGATLDQALEGRETVAEGAVSAAQALALAEREGVEMPIVAAVNRTLFEGYPAQRAIEDLMGRELRPENDR